ncbi:MAG: DUF3570 domain-containing protein [Deltaproteobacteria bacterium]|nr:DUF3570 domain-containing protein [Deltaproteobacteria bacterium]
MIAPRRRAAWPAVGWPPFAALLAVAWLAAPVRADELGTHAATGAAVYRNNDGLQVISPWLQARQRVKGGAALQADLKTDFISAASVDMISGASPRFHDTRNEAGLQALYDEQGLAGHAGYTYSTENDTRSHTVSVGAAREWLSRNLSTSLTYGLGLDRLGSVREPEALWHDRTSHRLDATITQLLSRTAVASLAYTVQQISGFQSSPYRMVPLVPKSADLWTRGHAQWVAEQHPDERTRHGVTIEARQALSNRWFLRALYRGYVDTWGVRANTGELGATFKVHYAVEVELSNRFYWQSRASFERAMYSVERDFMTRDRRLVGQIADSTQLTVRTRWLNWEAMLQGVAGWERYDDFHTLVSGAFVPMADTWTGIVQAALAVDL